MQRVPAGQLDQLLHPVIDPSVRADADLRPAFRRARAPRAALPCSIPTSPSSALRRASTVILVRDETTPEDFHGIVAARAVLTARGGMTSHAAVVARGMGKCAIVGCKDIEVDVEHRSFTVNGTTVSEGDWLTLDGATGRVFAGDLPTMPSEVVRVINGTLPQSSAPRSISRSPSCSAGPTRSRRLSVRANADTPHDARVAREFGAEGIGLCRTEHMFFEGDRITAMREMIVARDEGGRRRALAKLLPMQRADFEGIFEAMNGFPVTIRLLDPPLHEFLPHGGEESKLLARTLGSRATGARPHRRVAARDESDARASRLPPRHHVSRDHGDAGPRDLRSRRARDATRDRRAARDHGSARRRLSPSSTTSARFSRRLREQVLGAMGEHVHYLIGTMIELPRAALTADEIAATRGVLLVRHQRPYADDVRPEPGRRGPLSSLVRRTWYLCGRSVPGARCGGCWPAHQHRRGGRAPGAAQAEGRNLRRTRRRAALRQLCHDMGFDYVSCSPFRVPIARLAAAHAALGKN